MTVAALSRRRFLIGTAAAAGGFSLGFHLPFTAQAQERKAILPEVNAWVLIHPDDTVVIRIARSEMGQGTLTGLAQLVAEELDCDWSKVTTEYPTPGESLRRNRIWGNFSTGGSRGIRESHEYVRQGGAAAREMLIAAAATLWKVPEAECSAASSIITHNPSGRSVTYGAVASLAAHMQPPADVRLKDPKVWKIAGKPLPRLDTRDKLTGKQVYGVDLQLPGMLNASIRACPVFGGKVASFDAAAVSGMPGVRKVVQVDETAVAVVADTWWQAHSALLALPIVWDEGPNENVTSQSIAEMLKEGLEAEDAVIGTRIGDVRTELAGDVKLVSATYSYPYQHHATMEPMNATALYTTDRCEAWVPTQNGEASLSLVAEVSGLPIEQCDVHKLHLGGGFGRRGWHHEAGIDPLEFRRKLLVDHPKHLAVLEAVAERVGWGKPAENGIHRGLAQIMGFGSYVAAAAEVSVMGGQLRIHRIVAATDTGHIVNPAQAERQVEGSFVYGLSACLFGECTIDGGRVEQENFDTYEVMRMDQMPAVETILVPSGGFWGGVGEPTIAVAGPAVLNAVFAATGKRVRQLPLKNNSLAV
ncbi:xanthine dehydrogenase family protein molybdopterin-binding subunit [Sinorhizobium medicae]|uniref:xanthine dehydrogenase family protein molybdopterin-binding subunit n=1 Tax=Sinorhizobium medicae TaxID=110321 RepID=UPI000C7A3ABA|nr:molybdopterin cofactor-binding domain-containing protein [Sinorhizobium medicae]PLU33812.1 hypothetical protein BMJ26_23700 [Sinorhizobium medicae]PLU39044.1 hypothetical protein BMJ28_12000 [Sinorhizobium medicae]PLU48320.1 hypothetical protein BMJ24_32105 [Sinorhizobium medicae]